MINKDNQKVLMSGNEAIGEAAVRAGCQFYAGYPITPQNELTAYMAGNMRKHSRVFIQAESEIAAINMVFGAAAAGARAMTSSSSPGISLKQEGISYLSGAQLPCVIINVMRGGPGLGNIAASQSDYFQATRGGGHGDYRLIVLAPSSVQESFNLTMLAFELADKYRNPVMILTDAFIGQMAEPLLIRTTPAGGGSAFGGNHEPRTTKKEWALTGAKGRQQNIVRSFFLKEGGLEKHNIKLQRKYKLIEDKEKRYQHLSAPESKVLFIAYGTSFRVAKEAASMLDKQSIKVDIFRPVTLWPFPYQDLKRASEGKEHIFVFELSGGQMVEDVKLAVDNSLAVHFYGRMGGGFFSEEELFGFVKDKLKRFLRKSKKSLDFTD